MGEPDTGDGDPRHSACSSGGDRSRHSRRWRGRAERRHDPTAARDLRRRRRDARKQGRRLRCAPEQSSRVRPGDPDVLVGPAAREEPLRFLLSGSGLRGRSREAQDRSTDSGSGVRDAVVGPRRIAELRRRAIGGRRAREGPARRPGPIRTSPTGTIDADRNRARTMRESDVRGIGRPRQRPEASAAAAVEPGLQELLESFPH